MCACSAKPHGLSATTLLLTLDRAKPKTLRGGALEEPFELPERLNPARRTGLAVHRDV